MNVNRTGLSGEAIADTNVKLGGVDASAPMVGYGLVINMAAKSGQQLLGFDRLHGAAVLVERQQRD